MACARTVSGAKTRLPVRGNLLPQLIYGLKQESGQNIHTGSTGLSKPIYTASTCQPKVQVRLKGPRMDSYLCLFTFAIWNRNGAAAPQLAHYLHILVQELQGF